MPHEVRPEIHGAAHVVMRIRRGLPSLRTPRAYRVLERAIRRGKKKDGFAVTEFSVQRDHLHLIVEARGRRKLSRGMQGLMIGIAKNLNSFWNGRKGSVFADRYFALAITKYSQLWRTVRYVLLNGKRHGTWNSKEQPDPFSSGRWYRHWISAENVHRPLRSPPVERAETYAVFRAIGLHETTGPQFA